MPVPKLLSVYLQDHHAGSVTGTNLARRIAGQNEGTVYGEEMARIADEIEEDQRTLEELMAKLDVGTDRVKDAIAWGGEKVGRLKPNARLLSYSPLSRLIELEGLLMGVTAKGGMWRALEGVKDQIEGLEGFDFAALDARAKDQRSRLEDLRLQAASEALPQD